MPDFSFGQIPVAGNNKAGSALLISQVNHIWGQIGSGDPLFWEKFKGLVYRDSVATSAGGALQYLDGNYDLLAVDAMRFEYKGDIESRDLTQLVGSVVVGPLRAERVDGPAIPMTLRPGYDPTGRIRQAIQGAFRTWGLMLPLMQVTSLLVAGRLSVKHAPQLCYDGQPLFSASHKVNPTSQTTVTRSNLIVLPSGVDESAWTQVKDSLIQWPDFDGEFLPNATGRMLPLIMVPTTQLAVSWAHYLGAPGMTAKDWVIQQGQSAGISSVVVGDAEIMVNPYLLTVAQKFTAAGIDIGYDPTKRSFVFSRNGRAPFITREEQTPVVMETGPQGPQAHTNQANVLYTYAFATAGVAEYRSVLAVDRK